MSCDCSFSQSDIRIGKDGPMFWAHVSCVHTVRNERLHRQVDPYIRLIWLIGLDPAKDDGDVQA